MKKIARIRSGGQSGVDRAALDAARAAGIKIEGWTPKGGWAEDFPTPPGLLAQYPELQATNTTSVDRRTKLNVRDSHATLILAPVQLQESPGTVLTVETAKRYERPYLVSDLDDLNRVAEWVDDLPNELILNVAGPRESECPGVYEETLKFLSSLFHRIAERPMTIY